MQTAMHTVGTRFVSKNENVEFGYCTEFILQLSPEYKDEFEEEMITNMLTPLGDSIVAVKDEDIVKVHVHTLKPGDILNIGQKFGEFVHLKIENMTIQHNESQIAHAEEGPCECGEDHHQPPKRPEIGRNTRSSSWPPARPDQRLQGDGRRLRRQRRSEHEPVDGRLHPRL